MIAVIQVTLPLESLTMSDDANAPDLNQRIENMHKWSSTTDRDALVTVEEMQAFLNEMAEIHFMPPRRPPLKMDVPMQFSQQAQAILLSML